ncbi:helix-turn-helix domain-containing protein [Alkalibacter rhizosphaerae]|uniref:Helix-turn-helix domain-containing protein n=1 Tax=Alkalibacter rhizosphaerae TaxID=2815577 RepID=A0A975AGL4_9FIRM|nr:helix-turn-helix domain-containing protein [Alkalibacter rhizosphaerae]QSX07669.1 helix-turn-helix domain-containing protein [Alkalibacter rhizosphaerae]
MKLNLDIICDYLPNSISIQRFGPLKEDLVLDFPMLYETGCDVDDNHLYIARSETLPKNPPSEKMALVCLGKGLPQGWVDKNCQILLISNGLSLFYVINEINKIYERFSNWDNQLRDALEDDDHFDMKKILKIGTTILENPIVVVNERMLNIFYTNTMEGENNSLIDSEMIKDACRLERVIKEPYLSAVTVDGKQCYCNNLFPFGQFAGCISVSEQNRPFKKSDFPLANHFFVYFQKGFAKYIQKKPFVESPGTTALKNLLKGIPLSLEESKELERKEGECFVCFKLKNLRTTNYLPIEYMCTSLNMLFLGRIFALIDEKEIFGIIKSYDAGSKETEDLLNSLEEYLERMNYVAGLSNDFTDIDQTVIYKKQANYALDVGRQSSDQKYIYRFNDHVLSYVLTRYDGTYPAEYLYPRELLALKDHTESNVDLMETLDSYLRNEMNISRTSEEMFLHRSSLTYRLNKIKKILNMDLDDPDVRLYLRVCLHLMKLEQ